MVLIHTTLSDMVSTRRESMNMALSHTMLMDMASTRRESMYMVLIHTMLSDMVSTRRELMDMVLVYTALTHMVIHAIYRRMLTPLRLVLGVHQRHSFVVTRRTVH